MDVAEAVDEVSSSSESSHESATGVLEGFLFEGEGLDMDADWARESLERVLSSSGGFVSELHLFGLGIDWRGVACCLCCQWCVVGKLPTFWTCGHCEYRRVWYDYKCRISLVGFLYVKSI